MYGRYIGYLRPQMAGLPIPKLLGSLIRDLIRSRYAYKIAVGVYTWLWRLFALIYQGHM